MRMSGGVLASTHLTDFERAVLPKLLEGEHPTLSRLRAQVAEVRVRNRKWTGVGFFTDFELPPTTKPAEGMPASVRLGFGLELHAPELAYGGGFALLVQNGLLVQLEGFSYGERWADEPKRFELIRTDPKRDAHAEIEAAISSDMNERFPCLCCGYRTLPEEPPMTYNICPVCAWEDDSSKLDGPCGPNTVSLREARINFEATGASEPRDLGRVRAPTEGEARGRIRPLD
jgi:hypothetical protein